MLSAGEHLSFTVSAPETGVKPSADRFVIDVYDLESWSRVCYLETDAENSSADVFFSSNIFEYGREYTVFVDAFKDGYDWSETIFGFVVRDAAFENASKLVLPGSLQRIESEAFAGAAADAVIIPEGVTEIGDRAFANSRIKMVYIPGTLSPDGLGSEVFAGCNLQKVFGYTEEAWQIAEMYGAVFCRITYPGN